jgi:hypothetical protein
MSIVDSHTGMVVRRANENALPWTVPCGVRHFAALKQSVRKFALRMVKSGYLLLCSTKPPGSYCRKEPTTRACLKQSVEDGPCFLVAVENLGDDGVLGGDPAVVSSKLVDC